MSSTFSLNSKRPSTNKRWGSWHLLTNRLKTSMRTSMLKFDMTRHTSDDDERAHVKEFNM
jgi:hypothetical protein